MMVQARDWSEQVYYEQCSPCVRVSAHCNANSILLAAGLCTNTLCWRRPREVIWVAHLCLYEELYVTNIHLNVALYSYFEV